LIIAYSNRHRTVGGLGRLLQDALRRLYALRRGSVRIFGTAFFYLLSSSGAEVWARYSTRIPAIKHVAYHCTDVPVQGRRLPIPAGFAVPAILLSHGGVGRPLSIISGLRGSLALVKIDQHRLSSKSQLSREVAWEKTDQSGLIS
jgi:hypothetical protein